MTYNDIMAAIAPRVQEADSSFPSGLWTQAEVIKYINAVQNDFLKQTQAFKTLGVVEAETGVRQYNDPDGTMQVDRIAFASKPLVRSNRMALDLSSPAWRSKTGAPTLFHVDDLPPKTFETDKTPIAAMTGTGYTATGPNGTLGTLRRMSGAYTYTASGLYGIARRFIGARAYASSGASPFGFLRRMMTGRTNFETIQTQIVFNGRDAFESLTLRADTKTYLLYGTMARMLEKEGEGQDIARAAYCRSRYQRGVNLYRRFVNGAPIGGGR